MFQWCTAAVYLHKSYQLSPGPRDVALMDSPQVAGREWVDNNNLVVDGETHDCVKMVECILQ